MKRFKAAVVLIVFFAVVINILQIYLFSKSYERVQANFKLIADTSLFRSTVLYAQLQSADTPERRPPPILLVLTQDELPTVTRTGERSLSIHTLRDSLIRDTLKAEYALEYRRFRRNKKPNLQVVDSIYRSILASHSIHTPYKLDSVIALRSNPREGQAARKRLADKSDHRYPVKSNPFVLRGYENALVFAQLQYDYSFLARQFAIPFFMCLGILLVTCVSAVLGIRSLRKASAVAEMKLEFVNNMTHELQTPITVISAGMEALAYHTDPAKIEAYVGICKKQVDHLKALVDQILMTASGRKDLPAATIETISCKQLFDNILSRYRSIPGKQVRVEYQFAESAQLRGDRMLLETAFANLIDNSIKYSGPAVTLTIEVHDANRFTIVTLSDNGIGIPKKYQSSIFEKFFRVPHSNAQTVSGYGLGLSITRKIIEQHKGTIEVESSPGSGTSFTIHLPKQPGV